MLKSSPPIAGDAFQEFFESHPKWLYLLGEQYESAESKVKLPPLEIRQEFALVDSPSDSMTMYPDFFSRGWACISGTHLVSSARRFGPLLESQAGDSFLKQ